jgi:hypothetical protein
MKRVLMLSLFSVAACAQNVQVYSELARLSETGDPVAPTGHLGEPREILSPALARNAFTSFQIAIQVPEGTKFQLFMGQNPQGALGVTLYRRAGGKLEPVGLPYFSDSTKVLWMDVWVDASAPVRRVKLEPQVYIDGDWITYPMEVRVSEPVVPSPPKPPYGVMEPFDVMHSFLCGDRRDRPLGGRVLPEATMRFRNAQQDVRLAAQGPPALRDALKALMGGCSSPDPADPEFYLRLRDVFFAAPKNAGPKKVQTSGSPR